jgi:hypothetical protein
MPMGTLYQPARIGSEVKTSPICCGTNVVSAMCTSPDENMMTSRHVNSCHRRQRRQGSKGLAAWPPRSQTKVATNKTPPRTSGAMTAALFQGYWSPPGQPSPSRNRVTPAV